MWLKNKRSEGQTAGFGPWCPLTRVPVWNSGFLSHSHTSPHLVQAAKKRRGGTASGSFSGSLRLKNKNEKTEAKLLGAGVSLWSLSTFATGSSGSFEAPLGASLRASGLPMAGGGWPHIMGVGETPQTVGEILSWFAVAGS